MDGEVQSDKNLVKKNSSKKNIYYIINTLIYQFIEWFASPDSQNACSLLNDDLKFEPNRYNNNWYAIAEHDIIKSI